MTADADDDPADADPADDGSAEADPADAAGTAAEDAVTTDDAVTSDEDVPDGVVDAELYRRTARLLEPGDVELAGAIVHTDLGGDEDIEMMETSLEVGDVIAEHAGHDPGDVYVESGNDDPEFSSNQHQGLTIDDGAFVWECQQLLREGSFDLVFYYEAVADHEGILSTLAERGYTVQGVTSDA